MLKLQNGKFDSPNRMFHSIADVWTGVLTNQADVKELVPEFYHGRGEMLINQRHLNLGVRHDGTRLDDVLLPRWANNDPATFVSKLSEALESDYVSSNIHHWIDLIFGYKQRGDAALKADNLFYHLTYEGAVDIDTVVDPLERASIIAQIKEFGQTPKQLFTNPHPQRMSSLMRTSSASLVSELLLGGNNKNNNNSNSNHNNSNNAPGPLRNASDALQSFLNDSGEFTPKTVGDMKTDLGSNNNTSSSSSSSTTMSTTTRSSIYIDYRNTTPLKKLKLYSNIKLHKE
jgi:factor associated with neutral sphingomyelinase activation